MPDIPANFFTRSELQGIILRADELSKQAKCPEQQAALNALLAGAASLEGILAELTVTPHPVNKALANPNGWASSWFDGKYVVGPMLIGYSQQVLKMPGREGTYLATGRYRLTLGRGDDAETVESSDKRKLRALLVSYVLRLPEEVPSDAKEYVLSRMFADDEVLDAVQKQGAAEVDVRRRAEDGEAVG